MPGEALLIGIATVAVVVAGLRRSHQDSRRTGPAGRPAIDSGFGHRVDELRVTFESLLPAVLFPALVDDNDAPRHQRPCLPLRAIRHSVRSRQLVQAGVPWVRWTRFVVASGFTATALFGLNALVFASLTVYALALCIQLSVAAISFYSLAAGAE